MLQQRTEFSYLTISQDKCQCMRQLKELGELAEEAASRPRGLSNHPLDLGEKKLHTINK
jgi:hypothetical protein